MPRRDEAPEYPTGHVYNTRGFNQCSGCHKTLPARNDLWRCPWVGCRVWFRGTAGAPTSPTKDERENDARLRRQEIALRKAIKRGKGTAPMPLEERPHG